MKFARWVFLVAGIYGLIVITPFYFMEGVLGGVTPPALTHPAFFYGFVGTALAGRNELYERFYLASGARNYALAHTLAPRERGKRLVNQVLGLVPLCKGEDAGSAPKVMGLPRSAGEWVRK